MKTTLLTMIAIMLIASPAVAKQKKETVDGSNGSQSCVSQMTESRYEGEGRSGSKFQEQRLSDCLLKQQSR